MKVEAAQAFPEDENTFEIFAFNFHASTLQLFLIEYRRERLDPETLERVTLGFWRYPDLQHKSTLPEPEVPGWAVAHARFFISEKIHLHP